ncbi:TPA: sucrose-6-phosphate hydrolase [Streptococcus agalactiae]|uniref:hypothetical protein n=1 Tax=Streptococcus agalactiae TaxID=1311 RepID=UPI00059ACBEF|nr:hypothetical protein [Streptococcus agalactiae]MCP9189875.1 sucrose-6-phosphate hydrolase [Streptococcus agalactiae]OTG53756.1 sucrose-6-phosphate hydrolase [Streptococcus agalactiae]OTG54451.1 sucrose-6-phosphate hydrolase [Streptococcus agalactiae]OTG58446.1 sucrose-6-phosphate hydrolase [Streptococcus agalactiae]RRA72794.1 sucrose-6-phosphate hydrolase [Streptococcus agalactiae]
MEEKCVYLDTYVLQQDMRVRMPKSVLSNLNIQKGKTKFDIYLNSESKSLLLRIHDEGGEKSEKD